MCNLIARFWDVQNGAVRIGGKDVKNYTADSILEHISMVFQNVYLFHDSIENNIKFGKPDATHEEMCIRDSRRTAGNNKFRPAGRRPTGRKKN